MPNSPKSSFEEPRRSKAPRTTGDRRSDMDGIVNRLVADHARAVADLDRYPGAIVVREPLCRRSDDYKPRGDNVDSFSRGDDALYMSDLNRITSKWRLAIANAINKLSNCKSSTDFLNAAKTIIDASGIFLADEKVASRYRKPVGWGEIVQTLELGSIEKKDLGLSIDADSQLLAELQSQMRGKRPISVQIPDIRSLPDSDIAEYERWGKRNEDPAFDDLPTTCKLAVMDMYRVCSGKIYGREVASASGSGVVTMECPYDLKHAYTQALLHRLVAVGRAGDALELARLIHTDERSSRSPLHAFWYDEISATALKTGDWPNCLRTVVVGGHFAVTNATKVAHAILLYVESEVGA